MRAQVARLGCMAQVSLDLSAKRMADLAESGVDILELLGQSFQSIVDFYSSIEGGLVPCTMKALSGNPSRTPGQSHRLCLRLHLAGCIKGITAYLGTKLMGIYGTLRCASTRSPAMMHSIVQALKGLGDKQLGSSVTA